MEPPGIFFMTFLKNPQFLFVRMTLWVTTTPWRLAFTMFVESNDRTTFQCSFAWKKRSLEWYLWDLNHLFPIIMIIFVLPWPWYDKWWPSLINWTGSFVDKLNCENNFSFVFFPRKGSVAKRRGKSAGFLISDWSIARKK